MADFNPALPLPIKWSIGDDRFNEGQQVLSLTIPVDSVTHLIEHLNTLVDLKAKEIVASFCKEFNVPRASGFITEARHGEFLSHAISKIADD